MNKIILVGGSKGGVGKSMVSIAIAENYILNQVPVYIIETDTSNPDVGKIYMQIKDLPVERFSLDEKDGWLDMIDLIEKIPPEYDILVNTAARSNAGVGDYGSILNDNLQELGRELITFWPINRHRDSVELLKQYLATMTGTKIYVLYNRFYGSKDQFDVYNNSELSKTVNANGGSFEFPELAFRVSDIMANDRKPPHTLKDKMPIGTRIEYTRWIDAVKEILDKTVFKEHDNGEREEKTDGQR
jgi:hypothetical protein